MARWIDQSASGEGGSRVVLFLVVLVVCDLLAGQIFKALFPPFDHTEFLEHERAYRIRSEIYHHDLKPRIETSVTWGEHEGSLRTNSLGFKAREVAEVPLHSDDYRIPFLGDSFTEGVGVAYSNSFVGLIDRQWESIAVDVLNAGVASYSPTIYDRKLKYLVEDVGLDFDELVVFLDISDIDDEAIKYELDEHENVIDRPESRGRTDPFLTLDRIENIPPRALRTTLKLNSILLRLLDLVKDKLVNKAGNTGPEGEMTSYRLARTRCGHSTTGISLPSAGPVRRTRCT